MRPDEGMGVLNNREIAILFWTVVVAGLLLWKARAWSLLLGVVRSFAKPLILRAIGYMALYVAFCVWLLSRLGLWAPPNLKTTLVWFVGFGLVWALNVRRFDEDPNAGLRRGVREVLSATIFITFIAEFYTLPLWGEMILVPVVSFVSIIHVFSQGRKGHERVEKVFGKILAAFGWGVLGYAALRLLGDLTDFFSIDTGREFAVTPLLSLMFLPFLYALNVQAAYAGAFRVLDITLKEPEVSRFAKRQAILNFGLNIQLLRRWKSALMALDAVTRDDVKRTTVMMKMAVRRERNPPSVPIGKGWSPYEAMRFLHEEGLMPQDYNPSYGEWSASSPYRELHKGILPDNLAYYLSGTEMAATRLKVVLNVNEPEDEARVAVSERAFTLASARLLLCVLGDNAGKAIEQLAQRKRRRIKRGLVTVEIERDDFSVGDRYSLKLLVTHAAHVEPF